MQTHTYYDILGVTMEATFEEIAVAKNNLAKIYHPDANIHCNVDTTLQMQEILEAYEFLRDENNRNEYNQTLKSTRIFKTFQMDTEVEHEEDSFVLLWQAANNLHHYLSESIRIHKENQHLTKTGIPVFKKKEKYIKRLSPDVCQKLQYLKQEIIASIDLLSKGNLPVSFWQLEAMNWVLIRWGQKKDANYLTLFHRYEHYVETTFSRKLRFKRRWKHRQFKSQLNRILSFNYS
jgi:curved DNA-binding protein CbpA